jgi:hypothetical protein
MNIADILTSVTSGGGLGLLGGLATGVLGFFFTKQSFQVSFVS